MGRSTLKKDMETYYEQQNKRFCSDCQSVRSLDGGTLRKTRGSPRWICKSCMEKKSHYVPRV